MPGGTMTDSTLQSPTDEPMPALDAQEWARVRQGLHLLLQIMGKVTIAAHPYRNQWWQSGLHLTPTGVRTPLLRRPGAGLEAERFELEANLVEATLRVSSSSGSTTFALDGSLNVSQLYSAVAGIAPLTSLKLNPTTSEMIPPVRLDQSDVLVDVRPPVVLTWLRQLHQIDAAYDELLSTFNGKSSGGLLYWGGLDYALSLYNGRPNTPPDGAPMVYSFAENAENISFTYWVTEDGHPQICAYGTPAAAGDAGGDYGYGEWEPTRGEVVCALTPTGRIASAPDTHSISTFLHQTLDTLAANGGWDLADLRGQLPQTPWGAAHGADGGEGTGPGRSSDAALPAQSDTDSTFLNGASS